MLAASEPHQVSGGWPPSGLDPHRNDKADPRQVYRARQAAGWTTDANGWVAPDGTSEDDWAAERYPFPEEPGFAEWFSAFHHYQALDEDRLSPTTADAYPNA